MGVKKPLNRKELIEQHIESMWDYAMTLREGFGPLVSRRKVIQHIDKCRHELQRVHDFLNKQEASLDA